MYKWKDLHTHLLANNVVVHFHDKGDKAFAHVPNPAGGPPLASETIHLHGKGEFEKQQVDKICSNLSIPKMQ